MQPERMYDYRCERAARRTVGRRRRRDSAGAVRARPWERAARSGRRPQACWRLTHTPGPSPELHVEGREVVIFGRCVGEPLAISDERERLVLEIESSSVLRSWEKRSEQYRFAPRYSAFGLPTHYSAPKQ